MLRSGDLPCAADASRGPLQTARPTASPGSRKRSEAKCICTFESVYLDGERRVITSSEEKKDTLVPASSHCAHSSEFLTPFPAVPPVPSARSKVPSWTAPGQAATDSGARQTSASATSSHSCFLLKPVHRRDPGFPCQILRSGPESSMEVRVNTGAFCP